MTLRLSNIDLSSWDGILAFLRAELDGASSEQRRALLLESMAFVESDGLGDKDAAVSSLSQALGIDAGRSQSLWELWRNFDRLGNGDQEQVLSLLASLPEPSGDVEQRLLRLARFQRDTLGQDELAAGLVEQARRQWPEGFHGLLAEVETRLLAGHPSEAATSLERLSRMVDDACVRAALLVESAWLRKDSSSDDDITRLLEEALSEPVADWALIRETMDLAAEIGDWVLYESSLRKVAGASLENPDSEGGQWPMGHYFDGFERGPAVSAAYWWQVAMVRERRLGRPQAAAEALERALQICPGHPLLGYEHSRLMEALGHFDDALTSLPDSASKTRRAELLLLAGRSKEAAALFGEPAGDTVVEWALRDLLGVPALPSAQDLDAVMVFLHAHPEHPQSRIAAQMLLEHRDDEIAKLVLSEAAPKSTLWPPASTFSVRPTWQVASQAACALTSEDGTEAKRAILDWAEASSDATLRAVLTSVAARMTEESGELEQAFELYEYAQSLSPQTPAARLATLRLLLRLERYPDLVTHLLDHAATSSSPFHARAMLHQAGHIFRCKLNDGPSAAGVVDELCSGDSSDVPALWSAFELAVEAQDYSRAVDFLGRIGQQCPGDADWLCLLAAEIELFLTGDYDSSLSFLDRAAESTDEAVGRTARLYRMLVFYFRGDVTSLDEALQEEVLSSQDETGRMWIPELLEAGRGARGPEAMAELLEADDNSGPVKLLWLLLVGAMSGETSKLVTGLRALGSGAPPGEIAAACRAAAMVLDLSIDLTRAADLAHSDLEFAEVLYHASERLTRAVSPERRAEIALGRAELCREYDLADWADWRLEAAEAFSDIGDRSRGLSILQESLAVAPEHPGLLEAYAGLADALHDHAASLDAHCRLAAIYDDPSEKAHQLSLAASRAASELGLKEEGLRLARQAVEADPGSDVAHSTLTVVQRIAGDVAGVHVAIVGHLAATADPAKRVILLRELADHKLRLGDAEGCLTTLDQLLELDSTQSDALLCKIEILAGAGLVVEQLEVMDIYIRQEVDLAKA
ncbi:MAG: hypothetical protein MUC50_08560, partial [Myxococcota bacterium]|nr:hypothetical protein [Myxococcota bacterium]